MAKRILLWGAPTSCDGNLPFEKSFEQSGKNYGNILIGNAVYSFLTENEIVCRSSLKSPEEANEKCDQVVIPAANFLWKNFDFGYMADFLEKTNLPITITGVGAQTNDRTTTSEIHPNTLRLMNIISERSASLGVRGYYTAEVLAAHGIHNIRVIGCPSIYTSRCPSVNVNTMPLKQLKTISINFSRRVHTHSFYPDRMKVIENTLLKYALGYESIFIAQDEVEELSILASIENATIKAQIIKYFDQIDPDICIDYFRKKTKFFCNVSDWAKHIRSVDLSIGSRFHGNLIALTNGIPALTIVHDSRTMEMCALLGVPTLHVSKIEKDNFKITDIQNAILEADYSQFENSYKILFKRFVKFLNENGIFHNLPNIANA
ncbi:polysaccharide pyruvyl transferase family protein [Nitrosomonas sp. Nm166]|uniref:polysaccharide pyruvyl transferase family protein n=1 Tax=Nitrosomonas sp. Nm166 TaxID=1881054 RepID=UPI0008E6B2A1|nr:polysaccharide pyruvyl transferase family protein [Nitrosomonas sp. Nm166]SFE47229.1 Polysaccharide pyruvyl transferase [Nitrosomonas sp. Nm166]